eukprot:757775-Hanusia_phi.AAC.1
MRCRVDRLPTAEQLEILVAWAERRAESSVTTVYLIHDPALELPLERCSLTAVDRLAAALGEHNLLKRILSQQVFMANSELAQEKQLARSSTTVTPVLFLLDIMPHGMDRLASEFPALMNNRFKVCPVSTCKLLLP